MGIMLSGVCLGINIPDVQVKADSLIYARFVPSGRLAFAGKFPASLSLICLQDSFIKKAAQDVDMCCNPLPPPPPPLSCLQISTLL